MCCDLRFRFLYQPTIHRFERHLALFFVCVHFYCYQKMQKPKTNRRRKKHRCRRDAFVNAGVNEWLPVLVDTGSNTSTYNCLSYHTAVGPHMLTYSTTVNDNNLVYTYTIEPKQFYSCNNNIEITQFVFS